MPIGLSKTRCFICCVLTIVCVAEGFTTPTPTVSPTKQNVLQQHKQPKPLNESVAIIPSVKSKFKLSNIDFSTPTKQLLKMVQTATESTTLAFVLSTITTSIVAPTDPALATDNKLTVAQITRSELPSSSLKPNTRSFPIVGRLLANRFAAVDESSVPPVQDRVQNPKNALVALSGLAGNHADFANIAVEEEEETVRIPNSVIPTLSFQKGADALSRDEPSDWVKVENMGNGETYYFNEKTHEKLLEMPIKV